jgi:IS5 family transposase
MMHRRIGRERLGFAASWERCSTLEELSRLIVWDRITVLLKPIHASAKGEPAWPSLAMFKVLLLLV